MKRIIQIAAVLLLSAGFITHANVQFALTNKSSQPIWICVYADGDRATGTVEGNCEQQILPNDTLSQMIANGVVELKISVVDPAARNGFDRYRTYTTFDSANNKDKILIWNITEFPRAPLFPALEKHLMGLMKSKISNNITHKEFHVSKSKGL